MRKSLILVLIAIGGGVSYAAGVAEVATGPGMDDPTTWRWQVNAILTEQSAAVSRPAAERDFTGEADARGKFAGCVD
jgi:hypothetical protein